ncbi:HTH-type transcriptional regulator YofA [compost metagenome]
MKPLLDVLIILDALEKEGSFAAASAKLFKTPSALSYTVHKLESDLNIQLLDRTGHRARFTRTGQMLLEKGREVLHTVRESINSKAISISNYSIARVTAPASREPDKCCLRKGAKSFTPYASSKSRP